MRGHKPGNYASTRNERTQNRKLHPNTTEENTNKQTTPQHDRREQKQANYASTRQKRIQTSKPRLNPTVEDTHTHSLHLHGTTGQTKPPTNQCNTIGHKPANYDSTRQKRTHTSKLRTNATQY